METIILLILGVAVIFIIVQSTTKKKSPPRDLYTEATSKNPISPTKNTVSNYVELKEFDVFDTFELTGVHLIENKAFIINFCKEKDLVTIRPEPTNPVNPEALAVHHGNSCIGYIADDDIDEVKELISEDHKAGIYSISFYGNYLDVQIAIVYKDKN